jgi:hypothetical protein
MADPNYLAKVWALGGDKAKQLADGDWDANESMIVGAFWRERHRILETDAALLGWAAAARIRSSRGTSIPDALAAAGRREDLRLGRLRLRRAVVVPPARDAAGRSHADVLRVL